MIFIFIVENLHLFLQVEIQLFNDFNLFQHQFRNPHLSQLPTLRQANDSNS